MEKIIEDTEKESTIDRELLEKAIKANTLLSREQKITMILLLGTERGLTMNDIVNITGQKKATSLRKIRRLQEKKLIYRIKNADNIYIYKSCPEGNKAIVKVYLEIEKIKKQHMTIDYELLPTAINANTSLCKYQKKIMILLLKFKDGLTMNDFSNITEQSTQLLCPKIKVLVEKKLVNRALGIESIYVYTSSLEANEEILRTYTLEEDEKKREAEMD